jgi:hypothetical protein
MRASFMRNGAMALWMLAVGGTPGALAALGDCGQPVSTGDSPKASDCLHVLRTAVGAAECGCICDTNGSGGVLASDALLCLGVAVGQPLLLACDCPDLAISTPGIAVAAGTELTTCYYFRTSNAETLAIRKWSSEMSVSVGSAILVLTTDAQGLPVDKKPPGTVSDTDCGYSGGPALISAAWTYAAYETPFAMELPANAGGGKPLAMEIPPDSAGFVRVHLVNATDQPLVASVQIEARALPSDSEYVRTDVYHGYKADLSIPPMAVNDVETESCNVPSGASFWRLSTHAHRRAVGMRVRDGATTLFETFDFQTER